MLSPTAVTLSLQSLALSSLVLHRLAHFHPSFYGMHPHCTSLCSLSQRSTFTILPLTVRLCDCATVGCLLDPAGPERLLSTVLLHQHYGSELLFHCHLDAFNQQLLQCYSRSSQSLAPVHRIVQWCLADVIGECPLIAGSTAYCYWHTRCVSLTTLAVVHNQYISAAR